MALQKTKDVLNKNRVLKDQKNPWLDQFQLVGEYVFNRKQNFTEQFEEGAFLTQDIFDNTAGKNLQIMASALVGALWKNGAQSLQILPARGIKDGQVEKEYFEFFTNVLTETIDEPESGFGTALEEYMLDEGAFGTSGIAVFETKDPSRVKDTPVFFRSSDVKRMSIAEGEHGQVDTVYNERKVTVSQAVKKYGYNNLSEKTKDLFDKGKGQTSKIEILHAIEPRLERDPMKFGNKNMPFASMVVEQETEHMVIESGFEEMPIKVARFIKLVDETYGRSPSMSALPDAIEVNAIWESLTIAIEKLVDPPLGILDDGQLSSIIDTSAGALNVFNASGRIQNRDPVFQLFTVGELKSVESLLEKLNESLANHFFIDRLLDLNNETRMTLGEAQIRNELRAASLGSIFTRQITELFIPVIKRTINILLKKGLLGVFAGSRQEFDLLKRGLQPQIIPESIEEAMRQGEKVFDIKFTTPAARALKADEIQGIITTTEYTTLAIAIDPEAGDNLNMDKTVRKIAELSGMSQKELNDSETIKKLRTDRQAALKERTEKEDSREQSEVARNNAQAIATINGSGKQTGGQRNK